MLTNPTGVSTDSYAYSAYGALLARTGGSTNAYQFAGEQQDAESGLYYLRARYYEPKVGRFLSRDPIAGDERRPLSLHKYLYAYGNPVNLTDPSGLSVLTDVMETLKGQLRILRQQLPRLRRAKEATEETAGETSELLAQLFIVIAIIESDNNRSQLAALFGSHPGTQKAAIGELLAIEGDMIVRNTEYNTKIGWCAGTIARVYPWETPPPPSRKATIHLCPLFFKEPPLPWSFQFLQAGGSSKMGTIVHEFTHVTLRLDDNGYGCQGALDRARSPGSALKLRRHPLISPENFRCFVEGSALQEAFEFVKEVLSP